MKKLFLAASIESTASELPQYCAKKPNETNLIFIPTAAEGEDGDKSWLDDDRNGLIDQGFQVTEFSLTDKTEKGVRQAIMDADIVFVNGGNTYYLLDKARKCNFQTVIKEFISQGGIYGGSSAGSILAGPDTYACLNIENVERAPKLDSYEGLGLVDFVVFPHWGSPYFKDSYLNKRLEHAYNTKNKIILLTDNQYVLVEGDRYRIMEK